MLDQGNTRLLSAPARKTHDRLLLDPCGWWMKGDPQSCDHLQEMDAAYTLANNQRCVHIKGLNDRCCVTAILMSLDKLVRFAQ